MNTFHLSILASDRPFFEGECESLIIPIADGQYGVQANHKNVISAIVPGEVQFRAKGETAFKVAAVSNGMIKVEDNDVLVLVDTAEYPEEIDENRAKRVAAAAQEAILQKKSIQEYHAAQARMARAINRLRVRKTIEPK